MGGLGVVVRIAGFGSTGRGFGFAVTERPDRLVDWGRRQTPKSKSRMTEELDVILRRTRPLFVACEPVLRKSERARLFNEALVAACSIHSIMVLEVERRELEAFADPDNPTKDDIAQAIASRFRVLEPTLPQRRNPWQGEDERIGIFMAAATALAAWRRFEVPQ